MAARQITEIRGFEGVARTWHPSAERVTYGTPEHCGGILNIPWQDGFVQVCGKAPNWVISNINLTPDVKDYACDDCRAKVSERMHNPCAVTNHAPMGEALRRQIAELSDEQLAAEISRVKGVIEGGHGTPTVLAYGLDLVAEEIQRSTPVTATPSGASAEISTTPSDLAAMSYQEVGALSNRAYRAKRTYEARARGYHDIDEEIRLKTIAAKWHDIWMAASSEVDRRRRELVRDRLTAKEATATPSGSSAEISATPTVEITQPPTVNVWKGEVVADSALTRFVNELSETPEPPAYVPSDRPSMLSVEALEALPWQALVAERRRADRNYRSALRLSNQIYNDHVKGAYSHPTPAQMKSWRAARHRRADWASYQSRITKVEIAYVENLQARNQAIIDRVLGPQTTTPKGEGVELRPTRTLERCDHCGRMVEGPVAEHHLHCVALHPAPAAPAPHAEPSTAKRLRQSHRERGGRYRANKCYACGKSAPMDYCSDRRTDSVIEGVEIADTLLVLCDRCAGRFDGMSDHDVAVWVAAKTGQQLTSATQTPSGAPEEVTATPTAGNDWEGVETTEVRGPYGGTKVERIRILGTSIFVYRAYALDVSRGQGIGYSSLRTFDRLPYGDLSTRRITPEISALPAGKLREGVCSAYYAYLCELAYALIIEAFPEATEGSRSSGSITRSNVTPATLNGVQ